MKLSKLEIETIRNEPHLITSDLIQELRKSGKEGKESSLLLLDMPKDKEQYYLDQYGKRIAFQGIRDLKNPYTQHNLSDVHLEELEKCQYDIHYFKDYYVKIVTPQGVTFPSIREYQNRFLSTVQDDHSDIVQLMPRQCCSYNTKLKIKINTFYKNIEFGDLLELAKESNPWNPKNLQNKNNNKFIESYQQKNIEVLTPHGYVPVLEVHKTIPFKKIRVLFSNGSFLDCSEKHVLITSSGNEIHAKDSFGKFIKSEYGDILVKNIIYTGIEEHMFDISLDSKDEIYYQNGILSHNSGKSVSAQIYLQWIYTFMKNINIGICQNRGSTAREFLDKTKQIIINLPIWMQPGTESWNKMSIENDQGVKILTDSTNGNSFRGHSVHCLVVDECLHGKEIITIRKDNIISKVTMQYLFKLMSTNNEDVHLNNNYEVLTENGFKQFNGIKRVLKNTSIKITFMDGTNVEVTENHKFYDSLKDTFIEQNSLEVNNVLNNKTIADISTIRYPEGEYFYDCLEVHDGNHYIQSEISHSNCQFIRTTLWQEFSDSVFPQQSGLAWKKNILLSTQNGQNHFYDIVKGARDGINGFEPIEVQWNEVPRYKTDGTLYEDEEFKKDIIQKYGEIYFNQNFQCVTGDQKVKVLFHDEEKEITIKDLKKLYENIN